MAIMIDGKSSYAGESKVWECIKKNLSDEIVCYFNRTVNRREFDFCLLQKNQGLIVIEVKGWRYDQVYVKSPDAIEISGYDQMQQSPFKQARMYCFKMLEKFSSKWDVSPLVLPMVCYPFITKEQYYQLGLNIVSEEEQTIFKEDLENQQLLRNKVNHLFTIEQNIPHTHLDENLYIKIRSFFEPQFKVEEKNKSKHYYSILKWFKNSIQEKEVEDLVEQYKFGLKEIIFVSNQESFNLFIKYLNKLFKDHNIQFDSGSFKLGFKKGIDSKLCGKTLRLFNMELYLLDDLDTLVEQNGSIIEGEFSDNQKEILNKLAQKTTFNLQQYLLEHADTSKHILVEAGAGTGKTYSMVSRIAYLCNKSENSVTNLAEEIAMVTFTNDAADNMKVRLKNMFVNYFVLTGNTKYLRYIEDVDSANISTIHKFSMNILRESAYWTGLGYDFSITTDADVRKKILDNHFSAYLNELDNYKEYVNSLPISMYELKKHLLRLIDHLMNKSIDINQIDVHDLGQPVNNNIPDFNKIFEKVLIPANREYLEIIKSRDALDLQECIIALENVLKSRNQLDFLKLKYLFIDEFQDTDDVQIKLFKELHKYITTDFKFFIVGDLKQSIYRFRGAKMSAFKMMINGQDHLWEKFYLNINYRTDYRLLNYFDSVFDNMNKRKYLIYNPAEDRLSSTVKHTLSENELFNCYSVHGKDNDNFFDLLFKIIGEKKSSIENETKQFSLNNKIRTIAILVRNNWQVDLIVEEAKKRNLFIEVNSGGDLYELDSTHDLYKLVLALVHNHESVYLMNFIRSNFVNVKLNFDELYSMSESERYAILTDLLNNYFTQKMNISWAHIIEDINIQPILFTIRNIYNKLMPWTKFSSNYYRQKHYIENYELLFEKIINFTRVDALTINEIYKFLKINILTGQKAFSRSGSVENDGIRIICTTVHKSKGLEYGTVIMPYTNDDISDPKNVKLEANYVNDQLSYYVKFNKKIDEYNNNFDYTQEISEQMCEESRILYVGMTRAIRNFIWINNVDRNTKISWNEMMEVANEH